MTQEKVEKTKKTKTKENVKKVEREIRQKEDTELDQKIIDLLNMPTKPQLKKKTKYNIPKKERISSRYAKHKLSPETITILKKALQHYHNDDFEKERLQALEEFNHDDYFVVIYTFKKRDRKRERERNLERNLECKDKQISFEQRPLLFDTETKGICNRIVNDLMEGDTKL